MNSRLPSPVRRIGVVLAGGQASRMGCDKALLPWGKQTLLDHMIAKLEQTAAMPVYVSGERPGYRYIADQTPYSGPGTALAQLLSTLPCASGVLIVPVDMPLLPVAVLQELLRHPEGAFFRGHPLPAYLRNGPLPHAIDRVYALHRALGSRELPLPSTAAMVTAMANANTPQEWATIRHLDPTSQTPNTVTFHHPPTRREPHGQPRHQ